MTHENVKLQLFNKVMAIDEPFLHFGSIIGTFWVVSALLVKFCLATKNRIGDYFVWWESGSCLVKTQFLFEDLFSASSILTSKNEKMN